MGESIDENITITGSGSDFDGSDCESQSNNSESENQNSASVLREKHPRVESVLDWKKVDDSHICSKITFNRNWEYIDIAHGRV